MRRSKRPILIASRRSPLARVQAEMVGTRLAQLHKHVEVVYVWIESEGDRFTEASLADVGGKGLFVRAIERALLQEKADIAVHSLKDLPANPLEVTQGLTIAAVPRRADPRDCLVTREGYESIQSLPRGANVWSSSPRRAAQLRRLRPDLAVAPIRGNVETRLRKVLQDGVHEATLLAVAGLERAGLAEHAVHRISPDVVLPAAGQGAIAIQCRGDDHVTLRRCLPMNDADTSQAVHAERQVVAALRGDCHSPIAVFAEPDGEMLRLRARVLSTDGTQLVEADETGKLSHAGRVVKKVVKALRDGGAAAVLRGK